MPRKNTKKSLELDLKERIKELEGLYALNRLATEALPLTEILARFTRDIIPPSMQYPDQVFSKIILDGKTYSHCRNIERETGNTLMYDIVINDINRGSLYIGYIDTNLEFLEIFENKLIKGYADKLCDIIQHRENEDRLREEKLRAEHYLRIAGVIILAMDRDENTSLINETGCRITGYRQDELIGKNWYDLCAAPQERAFRKYNYQQMMAGLSEPVRSFENRIVTRTGVTRIISWHTTLLYDHEGKIVGSLSSGEDITLRVRIESEKIEMEKIAERSLRLAALGTMASGIAHEINQPLTALMSKADGLLYWKDQPDQIRTDELWEALGFISEQSRRIHDIIRHMRSLIYKEPIYKVHECNLQQTIDSALAMVRTQCREQNVEIVRDYCDQPTDIKTYPVLLEQSILNLVNNALDSLRNVDRQIRIIFVRTIKESQSVAIEIEDNGTGIAPAHFDHVFDPFFTTKSPMKGMGLGLSITENFIRSLGGVIRVRNAEKHGAIFRIELPYTNN